MFGLENTLLDYVKILAQLINLGPKCTHNYCIPHMLLQPHPSQETKVKSVLRTKPNHTNNKKVNKLVAMSAKIWHGGGRG